MTAPSKETGGLLEALDGPKGSLDAWLECHDEAECVAAIRALISPERTLRDYFAGDGAIIGWLLVGPNGLPMLRADDTLWVSAARGSGYKSDYEAGCKDVALYTRPAPANESYVDSQTSKEGN